MTEWHLNIISEQPFEDSKSEPSVSILIRSIETSDLDIKLLTVLILFMFSSPMK